MESKLCLRCGETKIADLFTKDKRKRGGLGYACKECQKEYNKQYRINNYEHLIEVSRKWKRDHRQECLAYNDLWAKNNPERYKENGRNWVKNNLEKVKQAQKKFYKNNPDKIRAWTRITSARLRSTPIGKLRRNISTMICNALKGRKAGRHWECFVDYTLNELKIHLEKLFNIGMDWNNYGKNGWEVDHKHPIALFDFNDIKEIRKCWALDNLQPLWSRDNKKKGKKLIY